LWPTSIRRSPSYEYEALDTLRQVATAVVGGEDDMITPVAHTERIIELLPSADAHVLPGCGHLGLIERHEEFDRVLDDLIERVLREC